MLDTYWNIGRRIVLEEQGGEQRAEYGAQLLRTLSKALTGEFCKGFSGYSVIWRFGTRVCQILHGRILGHFFL